MIADVIAIMDNSIKTNDWLTAPTKEKAQLMHHHRTFTTPSPHHRRTITAPSPRVNVVTTLRSAAVQR